MLTRQELEDRISRWRGNSVHSLYDLASDFHAIASTAMYLDSVVTRFTQIIWDTPPVATDGPVLSSLVAWLRFGRDFVKHNDTKQLFITDRHPFWNDRRGIWYFYCCHQDDQLTNWEHYRRLDVIPTAIGSYMTPDKISPAADGGYHDALPLGGWLSEQSAKDTLGKAALLWAKGDGNE